VHADAVGDLDFRAQRLKIADDGMLRRAVTGSDRRADLAGDGARRGNNDVNIENGMAPDFRATIPGRMSCVRRNGAKKSTSISVRYTSNVVSSARLRWLTPALLMRRSMPPFQFSAFATTAGKTS
jgi:hypothetical protein